MDDRDRDLAPRMHTPLWREPRCSAKEGVFCQGLEIRKVGMGDRSKVKRQLEGILVSRPESRSA